MAKNKMNAPLTASYDEGEWRAKQDLETLLEAQRIKADPQRMKAVRKCAVHKKEQTVKDLSTFAEIEENKQ